MCPLETKNQIRWNVVVFAAICFLFRCVVLSRCSDEYSTDGDAAQVPPRRDGLVRVKFDIQVSRCCRCRTRNATLLKAETSAKTWILVSDSGLFYENIIRCPSRAEARPPVFRFDQLRAGMESLGGSRAGAASAGVSSRPGSTESFRSASAGSNRPSSRSSK